MTYYLVSKTPCNRPSESVFKPGFTKTAYYWVTPYKTKEEVDKAKAYLEKHSRNTVKLWIQTQQEIQDESTGN